MTTGDMPPKFVARRTLRGYVVTTHSRVIDSTFARYKIVSIQQARAHYDRPLASWAELAADEELKMLEVRLLIGAEVNARHGNTGRKREVPK